MRKIIILLLALTVNKVMSLELGRFKAFEIDAEQLEMSLAVIDSSATSKRWLEKYAGYLVKNNIIVIVIKTTDAEAYALNDEHQGLLAAPAPRPRGSIEAYLGELGVSRYPAVIENGLVWQDKP